MPTAVLPDLSIVLTFLREGQQWSQAELAAAAGFSPNLINGYERGWKNLVRSRLEYLIALMGLPPERIDATLETLAENREAARAPGESRGLPPPHPPEDRGDLGEGRPAGVGGDPFSPHTC